MDFDQVAEEAFKRSACVALAAQMPNVDLGVLTAIYKAGFCDGSMHGLASAKDAFERTLAGFARGVPQ